MAQIDKLDIEISANSNKAIQGIENLTKALQKLDNTDLSKITSQLSKIANTNVSVGFKKQFSNIDKSLDKSNNKLQKFGNLLKDAFSFFGGYKILSTSISFSSDYIENMNLFQVSMGKYFEEANNWATKVQDILGVDKNQWVKAQGTFMSLANGFGMASEDAYNLSKGLVEISYDLASFKNLNPEEAFNKVRSGISGEIEPLRNLGISLSQATLQQIALEKGITQSISTMTESQKATLRYYAIVKQAKQMGAIGDFAKTLESPQNAIRVLQANLTQLARTIGNVFIPILTQVLPYLQAMTRVLTSIVSKIATLVGFEIPDWSNQIGSSQIQEDLTNATEQAKKLKKTLAGFDELNVLSSSSSDSDTNSGYDATLGLDFESVWNKQMLEDVENRVDEIMKKIEKGFNMAIEKIKELSPILVALGVVGVRVLAYFNFGKIAMAIWKIQDVLGGLLHFLGILFSPTGLMFGGIVLLIGLFITAYQRSDTLRNSVSNFVEVIKGTFIGVVEKLKELFTSLVDLGKSIYENVLKPIWLLLADALAPIFESIVNVLTTLWVTIISPLVDFIAGVVVDTLTYLFDILSRYLLPTFKQVVEFLKPIIVWLGNLIGMIIDAINIAISPLLEVFGFWVEFTRGVVVATIDLLIGAFVGFIDFIAKIFVGDFDGAMEDIKGVFEDMWESIKKTFKDIEKNFLSFGKNIIQNLIDGIKSKFSALGDTMGEMWNNVKNSGVGKLVGGVGNAIGNIFGGLFADGGVVTTGQMFIARESGAELVGNIGNRTSVMNNQQIVQAVSQGVAQAVASVMSNQSFNSPIYLDGKLITKNVVGNINQMTKQNGSSPLMI